jgi:hypothetical protein
MPIIAENNLTSQGQADVDHLLHLALALKQRQAAEWDKLIATIEACRPRSNAARYQRSKAICANREKTRAYLEGR